MVPVLSAYKLIKVPRGTFLKNSVARLNVKWLQFSRYLEIKDQSYKRQFSLKIKIKSFEEKKYHSSTALLKETTWFIKSVSKKMQAFL